jgi:hypothetical protein
MIKKMYYLVLVFLTLISSYLPIMYIWTIQVDAPYYVDIMKSISTEKGGTELRLFFNGPQNYTELLKWVQDKLIFENGNLSERPVDPLKIIAQGRAKCQEYAILYTALCLSQGYEARLVVAHVLDSHAWTEIKLNGRWVPVEPVDGVIGQPYRRQMNGRHIFLIIAYESSRFIDVTSSYKIK